MLKKPKSLASYPLPHFQVYPNHLIMVGEIIVFLYLGEKISQQIDYKGLIFLQAAKRVNLKSILNIPRIKFRILTIF
jgi:hypothetical protein